MKLFTIPSGRRVRIKGTIRWIEHQTERLIAEEGVFEATTTNRYQFFRGVRRRMLINHNIPRWQRECVWQSDKEVELLEE